MLGLLAKLRKATVSFIVSACPFVCPHGTTQLPLDGFFLNLVSVFSKIYRENSVFIKSEQKLRALYMKTYIHF